VCASAVQLENEIVLQIGPARSLVAGACEPELCCPVREMNGPQCIGCPSVLYPNMLTIVWFSSKIYLWYFRKCRHHLNQSSVGVDSSSRKRLFRSFQLRDLSKFHPLLLIAHIIHLSHYILSVQAGFAANRKKSDGVISWLYGGCGGRLNRETSNFSWVALAMWTLVLSIRIKVKGLRVFWNLAAISERVTKHFLTKEWWI
jgi:hypothetical protein